MALIRLTIKTISTEGEKAREGERLRAELCSERRIITASTKKKSPFLDMLIKIASCSFSVCCESWSRGPSGQQSRGKEIPLAQPWSLPWAPFSSPCLAVLWVTAHVNYLEKCLHIQKQFAYDPRAAIPPFPTWAPPTPGQAVGLLWEGRIWEDGEHLSWEHSFCRDCSCGRFATWN